jgi:hypothetical protein
MNISGHRALIWPTREISSGWPTVVLLRSQTGTQVNQITSDTRTERRKTASSFGIAMARDSNGTTRHARLKHISSVKCNKAFLSLLLSVLIRIYHSCKTNK